MLIPINLSYAFVREPLEPLITNEDEFPLEDFEVAEDLVVVDNLTPIEEEIDEDIFYKLMAPEKIVYYAPDPVVNGGYTTDPVKPPVETNQLPIGAGIGGGGSYSNPVRVKTNTIDLYGVPLDMRL
ncbi:hypothetical protein J6TS2_48450 [Heyndrickxia sporothermodurans]|nr:hypothetical protein J6TS2_48450 [Heyndrickxia sporothermodurans]